VTGFGVFFLFFGVIFFFDKGLLAIGNVRWILYILYLTGILFGQTSNLSSSSPVSHWDTRIQSSSYIPSENLISDFWILVTKNFDIPEPSNYTYSTCLSQSCSPSLRSSGRNARLWDNLFQGGIWLAVEMECAVQS
jgi:hypothetical protein